MPPLGPCCSQNDTKSGIVANGVSGGIDFCQGLWRIYNKIPQRYYLDQPDAWCRIFDICCREVASEKKLPSTKPERKSSKEPQGRHSYGSCPVIEVLGPSVVLARDLSHPHGDAMLVHGWDIYYYGINVARALEPWNIIRDYHLHRYQFRSCDGVAIYIMHLHIIPNPFFHVPLYFGLWTNIANQIRDHVAWTTDFSTELRYSSRTLESAQGFEER